MYILRPLLILSFIFKSDDDDLVSDVTDEVIINSLFALQQLPTSGAFPHFWTIPQLPDGEGGKRQEEQ